MARMRLYCGVLGGARILRRFRGTCRGAVCVYVLCEVRRAPVASAHSTATGLE